MVEQKVSPQQFDTLQRWILRAEHQGHGPEACIVLACNATGINPPKPFQPVEIVVDTNLSGGDKDNWEKTCLGEDI